MVHYYNYRCDICETEIPVPLGLKRHRVCQELYMKYYNRFYQQQRYQNAKEGNKFRMTTAQREYVKNRAISQAGYDINEPSDDGENLLRAIKIQAQRESVERGGTNMWPELYNE